jgi:hypothetical protein
MRIRITVRDRGNRSDDLRVAAEVRRALWAHSPLQVDPDNPLHGTHRNEAGRAYFEFLTNDRAAVDKVLREHDFADVVDVTEAHEELGEACLNCGNITGPVLPSVCPNCSFRDISPCPYCNSEVPRQRYIRQGGNLFRCPHCRNRVRLQFNDPVVLPDGSYNEPLAVVVEAEERVPNELR